MKMFVLDASSVVYVKKPVRIYVQVGEAGMVQDHHLVEDS